MTFYWANYLITISTIKETNGYNLLKSQAVVWELKTPSLHLKNTPRGCCEAPFWGLCFSAFIWMTSCRFALLMSPHILMTPKCLYMTKAKLRMHKNWRYIRKKFLICCITHDIRKKTLYFTKRVKHLNYLTVCISGQKKIKTVDEFTYLRVTLDSTNI